MKIHVSALIAASLMLSGCSPAYIFTRHVPVLGLAQDVDCPKGERVYYYRAEDVAICLPDVMVAYTHCVTELSVANSTSDLGDTSKLEIGKILDKVEGLKLSDEQKRNLTKAFEANGVIGEARAKAIEACKSITESVYSGKIAPDIEAAKTFYLQQLTK